ncbi:MAG: 6-phosphogluconolactonase [Segetibacter sp.]|jgi:6-phosphogluconolactonase|nr:6-phosphogluconolactonase [Segetibacter sp.]
MLHISKTTKEVLNAAAEYFVKTADEAIAKQGRFTVALSGGSSPKGLFELLASEYHSKVDWTKVFFFFGDERYVPADHPDSNALMAKKALFDSLKISPNQIFAIDTSLQPKETAEAYQKEIEKHFAPGLPTFDLILLGLGDDAHTASLFPHTEVVNATEIGVKEIFVPEKNVYRITFTAPLINLAYHIAFLVFGSSKAEAVRHVLKGDKEYNSYPAQLIQPSNGDVAWFMDEEAALKINSN